MADAKRYKHKTTGEIVEALWYTGNNVRQVYMWGRPHDVKQDQDTLVLEVHTPSGTGTAQPRDWLVWTVREDDDEGDIFIVRAADFERDYEPET